MASSQRLKVSWKKEMPSLIRFMLCLTSSSSEIKNATISCSKAHRSPKHLAVYMFRSLLPRQPGSKSSERACSSGESRMIILKETTTLLSVKEIYTTAII